MRGKTITIMAGWAVCLTIVGFCLTLAGLSFARAEGTGFTVVPKWVRPGTSITVHLGPEVDTARNMYLRISSQAAIYDFALNGQQLRKRIIEVKIPGTVRAGIYQTYLIDEDGRELGIIGSTLKIAASDRAEERPVITKIVPIASYAVRGRYDFDLVWDNFGDDVRGIKILINDSVLVFSKVVRGHTGMTPEQSCEETYPCLVWSWKKLSIRGLSLEGRPIIRPIGASVEVDGIQSNRRTLILSPVGRITPMFIAFAALGFFIVLVYFLSRKKARQYDNNGRAYATFAYIFIDQETNTYSLSRLQLILWSAAAIVAYMYLAASQALVQWNWALCEVPENLPVLLGISAGTTAISLGTTGMRGNKGAGTVHPELGDFITSGGVFAPERLQYFLWTVIGVFGFVTATLAQDPATLTYLPKIPESFIPLMGISSFGYLAGKFARKPGPIITQLDPPPPYHSAGETIRIIGQGFSRRAQVRLNGRSLLPGEICIGPDVHPDDEFVRELIVRPENVPPGGGSAMSVKVINPDGQSAER